MTDSAQTRICPQPPETTPEQDLRAKVRYYIDEEVGDMAYELIEARKIITDLLGDQKIDEAMQKRLSHIDRSIKLADFLMEDGDYMERIEARTWIKDALSEKHCGDCTGFPASCGRCIAEDYYGLPSTVTWRSKGEGHSLYHEAKKETE